LWLQLVTEQTSTSVTAGFCANRLGGDALVTLDCEVVLGAEREPGQVVDESDGPDDLEQPGTADVNRRPHPDLGDGLAQATESGTPL